MVDLTKIISPEVAELIEKQADDFATGLQDRRFLREDDGTESLHREMIRLNLEQFKHRLELLYRQIDGLD